MYNYVFRLCREYFSEKMYTINDKRFLYWNAEPDIFYNVNAPKIAKPRRKRKAGL